MAAYCAAGFPDSAGLSANGIMIRRRTDATISLGRAWWDEVSRYTLRDQLSLQYLLWKHDIACRYIEADIYKPGLHFVLGRHAVKR